MPPVRTMPAKPMKTERTHEENQERAYIAASRRSDRSLEARMESARRASEIHKKRTGRALRVTEQDVVNEEMYEEEDEDLDAQIRRLTSHMATGDPSFAHRIHSLLMAQSQIRMNLHNAAQYSNGASFAPNQYIQNMQTMQMQNLQYSGNMQQAQQMQPMQPIQGVPDMTSVPDMSNMSNVNTINPHVMAAQMRQPNARHTPYPMMNQGMRQQSHQRSASIATGTPGNRMFTPSPSPATSGMSTEEQRRLSLPASARPTLSRNASSIHTIKTESPRPVMSSQTASPSSKEGSSPQNDAAKGAFYSVPTTPLDTQLSQSNATPLTSSLPTESQQILGPHLDPNDPRTNILMAGSNFAQQPFFGFNPNPSMKPQNSQFSYNGMNQTLAHGMPLLDTTSTDFFSNQPGNYMPSASTDEYTPTFSPLEDDLFSASFDQSNHISRSNSSQGVNVDTQSFDFDNFIDSQLYGDSQNYADHLN